jgi:hypothetical protein
MSTLFEQDEALSNIQASALLIRTLESRPVSPLLGLEPPAMTDLQMLAYFRAASWQGTVSSVVRDWLTQPAQKEEGRLQDTAAHSEASFSLFDHSSCWYNRSEAG